MFCLHASRVCHCSYTWGLDLEWFLSDFFGNRLCVSIILINNIAAWGTPDGKTQVAGILDNVCGTSGCTERVHIFFHLNVQLHDFNSLASFPSFCPLYGSHVPSYIEWNRLPQACLNLENVLIMHVEVLDVCCAEKWCHHGMWTRSAEVIWTI